MKKIPTVFLKKFDKHKYLGLIPEFTNPECENAFLNGTATLKIDGSATAIFDGKFYVRYDAKPDKHGKPKPIPQDAIPCSERDPITGHLPCWIPADFSNPNHKWYIDALSEYIKCNKIENGTYEAVGPSFQSNPYCLPVNTLYKHGSTIFDNVPRTFEEIKGWLSNHYIEGLVFWVNNEPICKIRRRDFFFEWNSPEKQSNKKYSFSELFPQNIVKQVVQNIENDRIESLKKVTCPYCGYKMPIEIGKNATSKGLFVQCKGSHCKQRFEIKL